MKKDHYWALGLITVLIVLDQVTKYIVEWAIPFQGAATAKYPIIRGFLYLTHHRNDGAAWGVFSGQMVFFILITVFALGVFAYLAKDMHFRQRFFYSTGLMLLSGGALGNFIDRVRQGFVVDFIDVYIFSYNFPVFNVADIALTIGMFAFAYHMLFLDGKTTTEPTIPSDVLEDVHEENPR
ncbi:MAG: signal peptidase II [Acholeplasmatales bacterium]|nr:MAG: signal peptidase II [Acholeplasmatales bacterium]